MYLFLDMLQAFPRTESNLSLVVEGRPVMHKFIVTNKVTLHIIGVIAYIYAKSLTNKLLRDQLTMIHGAR